MMEPTEGSGLKQQQPTGTAAPQESNKKKYWPGILWGILWCLILLFLAWPLAFFIGFIYILLLPFMVCIDAIKDPADAMFKLIALPVTCTENMVQMKPLCK